jgi:mono/diheme cytochrome c family protein
MLRALAAGCQASGRARIRWARRRPRNREGIVNSGQREYTAAAPRRETAIPVRETGATRLLKSTFLICLVGVVLAPAASSAQGRAGDTARGQELFLRYCAGCHGEDGRGEAKTFRPSVGNLAVKQLMDQVSDEYLFTVIKKGGAAVGKNAAMPAWGKQIPDQDIRDIVGFVRTLAKY